MTVLLTIGEFSRMTHLSVKALRHYHDVGLLAPADVDPGSGYRLYTTAQVPTAQMIRRFRDLEMPLEQVRAVLEAPDVDARNAAISEHLARMEQRLEETQATVASLRVLLEDSWLPGAVEFRSVGSTSSLAIRERVTWDACGAWLPAAYAELYAAIDAARLTAIGPPAALYPEEFFEMEAGDVVAFVPVTGHGEPAGRVQSFEVPASELAVMMHNGPFDDMDQTYGALGSFVAERALGVSGPIREYYLVTDADTDDATQHRTEVCWPISQQRQGAN